ncbi:myozenin-1a [Anguilla rostrata]|uniref:myozenin-1a n=1 Tax=Anguilla rostrata TaxID=7938 RepID=UPI0030CC3AD1
MPLSGTPAPNKRKKSSRIITDLSHLTQDEYSPEQEASALHLGKKIGIPKDIMLEELSLLKNKGSLMFKMRQKRVERFIYENNPDVFIGDSMDDYQKLVPSLGGKMDVGGHLVSGHMVGYAGSGSRAPAPPPKPGSMHTGGGVGVGVGVGGGHATGHGGVAGGKGQGQQHGAGTQEGGGLHGAGTGGAAGGHGAGGGPGKKIEFIKTYVSPWERAMKGKEELVATLKPHMPGPETPHELQKYKSFNRSAMPYGGFEKASQLMTFQLPEMAKKVVLEPTIVYPHDINSRPSFNRTPIGWIGSGETSHIHVEMENVPFDAETEEL